MTEERVTIGEVLAQIIDLRARGKEPPVNELIERYPHLAKEIREQLVVFETLDRMIPVDTPGATPPDATSIPGYVILREIGRGGMGAVFLAEQLSLHRMVALKLLEAPMAKSYRRKERFRREAEIAARLRHPNLVTVYDVGESGVYSYFAMEYVRGVTIGQMLARLRELELKRIADADLRLIVRDLLPEDDEQQDDVSTPVHILPRTMGYFGAVAGIIADLAEGLSYAHSHGVVHRDVKPQNVLLNYQLTPQLADFGIAKEVGMDSLSLTGDLIGTPYYMSPELAMAGRIEVDHRTDIYSLGVTMFEMLTLELPFSGTTSHEVLRRIMLEDPPSPRKLNPAVPRDLQVIVLKCMEKDPDHRYGQVSEMADDLRRFLRFETIHARPPSMLRIAGRFLRRHRVAGIAAMLLMFLAIVVNAMMSGAGMGQLLESAETYEASGDLVLAKRSYQQVLEEFPDNPSARKGLDRTEGRIAEESQRLTERGSQRLAEGRYVAASYDFVRSMELQDNLRDLYLFAEALGFFPIQITSDPPGALVTLHQVHEVTGTLLPGERWNEPSVERPGLPVGEYVIVVDQPGFGFGEYSRSVSRDQEDRSLHAVLRPTESVIEDMIKVPADTYPVGYDHEGRWSGVIPWLAEQEVEVEAFYIDRTEVSKEQYLLFVEDTGHPRPQSWEDGRFPQGEAKFPVVDVSWDDARAYAEWAGKRLPTAIEWEVAARGLEGYSYAWGNEYDASRANLGLPTVQQEDAFLTRVTGGPVPADSETTDQSPFGLLHMGGNVREWVWDPWVPPQQSGPDQRSLSGVGDRVVMGSSYSSSAERVLNMAAFRGHRSLVWKFPDFGFRCAKSVDP